MGQSSKFRSWKFLTIMDLKSQFQRMDVLWFITKGDSQFAYESHIPNSELRSSAELLSELQKSEGRKPCLTKPKTRNQETGAVHVTSPTSIKGDLCGTPSAFFSARRPFFTQRTIPATEKKWKVIPANSSCGGALSMAVSKIGTRMVRHYDQDERQSDAALHRDTIRPVLLKAFAKHGARDFSEKHRLPLIHEGSSKTRIEYCEDSKNSLAYFRAIQAHSAGIPNDRELKDYIRILFKWKEFIFHRCCFSASSLSLKTDWFWVERKATKDDRLSSTHHLALVVETAMKKNPMMITQFLKKCTITVIGNVIRMPFIG